MNIPSTEWPVLSTSRKIRPRKGCPCTGKFFSRKLQCLVPFESLLERDFCLVCEFESRISSYRAQPLEFLILTGDRKVRYTPDFLVMHSSFPDGLFIEVKPAVHAQKERLQKIRAVLCEAGVPFLIITDYQLRYLIDINRLKHLYRERSFLQEEFSLWQNS